MNHTPGPWIADGTAIYNPKIGTIAVAHDDMSDKLANATLISAAPDLLAALVELRDLAKTLVEYQICVAAIAKATGERT